MNTKCDDSKLEMTIFRATVFIAEAAWDVRKGSLHFVGLQWRQSGKKSSPFKGSMTLA
jgi:hypothetical protein